MEKGNIRCSIIICYFPQHVIVSYLFLISYLNREWHTLQNTHTQTPCDFIEVWLIRNNPQIWEEERKIVCASEHGLRTTEDNEKYMEIWKTAIELCNWVAHAQACFFILFRLSWIGSCYLEAESMQFPKPQCTSWIISSHSLICNAIQPSCSHFMIKS